MSFFNQYDDDSSPKAMFIFNLSPMAIVISRIDRKWYDFVASVCAVIGGSFTVLGIFNGLLTYILPKK